MQTVATFRFYELSSFSISFNDAGKPERRVS